MKKIALFFFSFLVLAKVGFADNLTLENQTTYPMKKSKMAIQWAHTAKEVDEDNKALIDGKKMNPNHMQMLTKTGSLNLNIPPKAEYFRVLVWSKGEGDPDLITNWVDVVPNKCYILKTEHLTPTVLSLGMGC